MCAADPAALALARGSRAMLGLTLRSLGPTLEIVSLQQWRVMILVQHAGQLRLVDIAEQLDASAPSTTRMVARLVTRGLLSRRVSERSRRESIVEVTEAGRQLIDAALSRRVEAFADLLDGLTTQERRTVVAAAGLISTRLGDVVAPGDDL